METTNLFRLTGTWESFSGHESLIITHNHDGNYWLIIVYMKDNGQASPSVYEINEDEEGLFISQVMKRLSVIYDPLKDMLSLHKYGDYLRN